MKRLASSAPEIPPPRPCSFFALGTCTRGSSCRFSHTPPTPAPILDLSELAWPQSTRSPSSSELALRSILIIDSNESGRGIDLPSERIDTIRIAATAVGFSLHAAFSLRRGMLREMSKSSDIYAEYALGSESAAFEHAQNFEKVIQLYLTAAGVSFETEVQLKERGSRATPDFRINAKINGIHIHWIDCKTYYCSSTLKDSRLPVNKLSAQAQRYNTEFGPGAFIFLCGVSADAVQIDNVLFLDANAFDTSTLFSTLP
jgi:hypothetical protein